MSEETGKEQILLEYARYAEIIVDTTRLMYGDLDLNALIEDRVLLNRKIDQASVGYQMAIEGAKQGQVDLKAKLLSVWGTGDKTFKCPVGTATLRATRSLQVKDKGKLIEFLTTLRKLPEFIKSFEIAKLRKIKDAGLLEDEVAAYDEKRSVTISINEVE